MYDQQCIYLGHDWGDWEWLSGCSSKYIPGQGNIGAVHDEIKRCQRCKSSEIKIDLPGKYNGMNKKQKASLMQAIEDGEVRPY